jgi:uncharacterized phage protein (TIGR01671 family)
MRIIKFRAWDENAEVMFYSDQDKGDYYFFLDTDGLHAGCPELTYSSGPMEPPQYEHREVGNIMQYTGLFDKNGKEIYESDIMIAMINSTLAEAEVKFYNGCFYLQHIGVEKMAVPLAEQHYWQEIIGNIYENPELLK